MTIEQRMERLERQNKRLKGSFYAVALAGLALLLMGQAAPQGVPEVVRAKRFEVVDEKGKEAIFIGRVGGASSIITLGGEGEGLVSIGTFNDGTSSVYTYDKKRKKLVGLGSLKDGTGAVFTYDGKGNKLIELGASKDGEGRVITYNRAGGVRAAWPTH